MSDFASLVQMVAGIMLVVVPFVLLARLVGGDDVGVTLTDVFSVSVNPPWPHRVQEEEPTRWRVERLRPRRAEPDPIPPRAARPVDLARPAGRTHPVVATPVGSEAGGCR